ncbi:type VI secretion system protein TssA [Vibrio sp. S4M6]|uniref:type VI secretion system protein TssA n=1 Tax=Vibrio sinus TaxID=2946865 RepID=UPI00202A49DD|nr:type VI secretion system protein TssA [Vibrio sinus]MCL9781352.1 type VI secretion system protein TssA [Vibrio sinus]
MMTITNYRDQLRKPISENAPAGERITDDPELDFIETQMMKVGSLSHAEVLWQEVEEKTVSLLSEQTKDIKLLTVLLQCLQYQAMPERFSLSLAVFVDFLELYWEVAYPIPGNRGLNHRKKFFSQICQRTSKAAEKLDGSLFNAELKEQVETELTNLSHVATKYQLDQDLVDDIGAKTHRQLAQIREEEKRQELGEEFEPKSDQEPTRESVTDAVHSKPRVASTPPPTKLDIDGSNDRSIRTSLLKMADYLSEMGGEGTALSIRLRRFAVWFSISSLPEANNNNETQLMSVSTDRISEYEEQLQRGADLTLWKRVEQSLTVSPFWLDGHHLSYRIAKQLNQHDWANNIRDELSRFVARLPELTQYTFKGGVPFTSASTLKWLKEEQAALSQDAQQVGSWSEKRSEALQLVSDEGLPAAMAMVNDGLSHASEPRDSFYWRLISADLMQANQLEAIAQQQYQTLYSQVKKVSVIDWEPSLLEQLEHNLVNSPD